MIAPGALDESAGSTRTRSSMTAVAWRTRKYHDDEKAPTVTAFTRRALDWFLDHPSTAFGTSPGN